MGNTDAGIPVEMVFAAGGAVTLASVFIAQAGEFIAAADTIAVAGFGRGFDGDERHVSAKISTIWERGEIAGLGVSREENCRATRRMGDSLSIGLQKNVSHLRRAN